MRSIFSLPQIKVYHVGNTEIQKRNPTDMTLERRCMDVVTTSKR